MPTDRPDPASPRERLIDAAVRIDSIPFRLGDGDRAALDAAQDDFETALRDLLREELITAFDAGWRSVPEGAPGSRRSAGLSAVLIELTNTFSGLGAFRRPIEVQVDSKTIARTVGTVQ